MKNENQTRPAKELNNQANFNRRNGEKNIQPPMRTAKRRLSKMNSNEKFKSKNTVLSGLLQKAGSRLPILLMITLCLAAAAEVFGQNRQQTDNKADQTLRGSGRVNPSTLALEMDVPLASYPGRGSSLPVSLSYSSKAWRMKFLGLRYGNPTCNSRYRAKYGENSAAGWTSSLGIAYIEYTGEDTTYNQYGFAHGSAAGCAADGTANNGYIKRIQVHLPNGESHELRASDTPVLYPSNSGMIDMTGTYYAVDGSRLKYVEDGGGTYRLYLPNGSAYDFASAKTLLIDKNVRRATLYKDVNGNQLTFNEANTTYPNGYWTDTLNRTIPIPVGLSAPSAPTTQIYQLPGLNGNPLTYKFYWKQLKGASAAESGLTDFNQNLGYTGDYNPVQGPPSGSTILFHSGNGGVAEIGVSDPPFNPVVLGAIEMPNGQKYQFGYTIYGEIDRIVYPTGGEERLTLEQVFSISGYNTDTANAEANRGVTSRSVYENANAAPSVWRYATVLENFGNVFKAATTAPDGTHSERFLYMSPNPGDDDPGSWGFNSVLAGMPYEERSFSAANQLLAKKLTSWTKTETAVQGSSKSAERHPRVTKEESVIYDPITGAALSAATTMDYAGDLNAIDNPLNISRTSQYSFTTSIGSLGTLEKSIETDYLSNSSYEAVNLRSLPTVTRIKDSTGNIVAQSQVEYDEAGYGNGIKGQPTTARSWTDVANNQYVETHAKYDVYGNVIESTDAKGNVTQTEYSAAYGYAYPTKVTSPIPDPSGVNGSLSAFETTTTYDLTTGLPLTTTDVNGQVTTMEYNDSLLRPTKVIPPTGAGQTVLEYVDTPGSVSVKTRSQIDATNWEEETAYYDGLNREIKTQVKDNQGDKFSETIYDNMGRIWKTSNPYRQGETKQWTEKQYDDLGRLKNSITPDGAQLQSDFGVATSGNQIGTTVTVTDQAGKKRRSVTNALGQLIRVDEPDDGGDLGTVDNPNQPTIYSYDTSDNLTQINQGGQTRTFSYDALDRLKSASNPESGNVAYSYDANSNMTGKTDARSVITTITYDALNRPKSKTYSDGTPTISYFYDSGSVALSKGKLTKTSNGNSFSENNSFDALGRILSSRQTTDGQSYSMSYSYDLGGNLLEETYPSGRKVKNTFDSDADLSKVETQASGGSYQTRADNFSYAASGSISSMKLGNNRWESAVLNATLQPTQIALGTTQNAADLLKLEYAYGTTDNNGNVKSQTITIPNGFTAIQNYTYDSLNRVKTAVETISSSQTWKQTFLYDRFGNRTFDLANTTIPNQAGASQAVINPSIDSANNRFTTSQGYVYDLSGNLIQNAEGRKYLFDGENKQTELRDAATNQTKATYSYDGDGRRVKKTVAATGEQTVFVYDADGDLVAEYLLTALTPQTPTTQYLTNDSLGSPRIVTDGNGDVFSRRDFAPFGEDLIAGVGSRSQSLKYDSDAIRQKFTGKQRDNETGLDYFEARYYSSRWGRFVNPDEFTGGPEELIEFDGMMGHNPTFYAEPAEPQSLNKYQYCLNNPLRFVDRDGHQTTTADILKIAIPVIGVNPELAIPAAIGFGLGTIFAIPSSYAPYEDPYSKAKIGNPDALSGPLPQPQDVPAPQDIPVPRARPQTVPDNPYQRPQQPNRKPSPRIAPPIEAAKHRKNRNPANLPRHQKGDKRRDTDQGGEKADQKEYDRGLPMHKKKQNQPKGPGKPKEPKGPHKNKYKPEPELP